MRSAPVMLTLLCLAMSVAAQEKEGAKAVSFSRDIQPIFKQSCLSCHKADKKKGKLDMSTYDALLKGGAQGPPVKAGDPAKSILVEVISGKEPEMPEKGDPLKPDQVELIARWIKEGAKQN